MSSKYYMERKEIYHLFPFFYKRYLLYEQYRNVMNNISSVCTYVFCKNERKKIWLLPKYLKLAEKQGKDIEAAFHPGFVQDDEVLMDGIRKGFAKFYLSRGRKIEFDALIKLKEYK